MPDVQEKNTFIKSRSMAKASIERYFSAKNLFSEDLLSDKYVNLCLETDICSGSDLAYKSIESSSFFKDDVSFCPIEKEVRFVIKILQNMSRLVPQEFSAGILLMHLEIVEGIKIHG